MAVRNRTQKLLAVILPAGMLGVSAALASASTPPSTATPSPEAIPHDAFGLSVADRLQAIRSTVSDLERDAASDDPNILLAQWVNFNGGGVGWRNGGWGNGGWRNAGPWRNAGWGNGGWRNGWGNGGWRNNWGNGGNGWHNFWHNW
jgi:rSAM-associated Gly-rich repeat protein